MMRELDHVDLLVICSMAGPFLEDFDLMAWHLRAPNLDDTVFEHPSIQWWCKKRGSEVSFHFNNIYRT